MAGDHSGLVMYDVTIEPHRQLLTVRVEGFWTAATMADYLVRLREQSTALGRSGGCRRILIDMSSYPIQSTEVAEGHAAALLFAKEKLGARAAIVMTSALSRMQASRVAASAGLRIFGDEASAIDWLMQDAP